MLYSSNCAFTVEDGKLRIEETGQLNYYLLIILLLSTCAEKCSLLCDLKFMLMKVFFVFKNIHRKREMCDTRIIKFKKPRVYFMFLAMKVT